MSIKIDQAFITTFIDSDFGLEIAHENTSYKPTAGTEYVELINIPNDETAFTFNDSNQTDGLFRIILYWPDNEGSINAKLKADEILASFSIGTTLSYDSQNVFLRSVNRSNGVNESGWYKTVISVGYFAEIIR